MEGVGARLGRSSTRYGPATVFNGAVRKWKKKWVHVAPSNSAASNNTTTTTNHSHQIHNQNNKSNGTTNGNNGSHLLLYKWTPITQSNNGNNSNGDKNSGKDDEAAAPQEPPRRKFKYIPIAVLEEQKNEDAENEAAEKVDDDSKSIDTESTPRGDILDEKPDINDLPMEESKENNQVVCQDLNESTLDLSLGLKGHDGDHEPDSKLIR
ncbi:hypothetical protein I3843_09G099900 [Carya illinoinensis]|uniref:Uncharacterized protein n=1 Tax=Carya illinoinensis TaxID=32201 RepID=A0A922J830_CARIL|nr:hypothetical protein I3842_09G099100 [Carya illinoinensis]KAG7963074.1 hypothetical protein I3843_09G099900 [Carya illinoinensis]